MADGKLAGGGTLPNHICRKAARDGSGRGATGVAPFRSEQARPAGKRSDANARAVDGNDVIFHAGFGSVHKFAFGTERNIEPA